MGDLVFTTDCGVFFLDGEEEEEKGEEEEEGEELGLELEGERMFTFLGGVRGVMSCEREVTVGERDFEV